MITESNRAAYKAALKHWWVLYDAVTGSPVLGDIGCWRCPACSGRFGTRTELVDHLVSSSILTAAQASGCIVDGTKED